MPKGRRPAGAGAQELDSPWKEALQRFLEPCLAFYFPQAHAGIDWSRGYQPEHFREAIHTYEMKKHIPYVTSIERLAKEEGRQEGRLEGLLRGIELALAGKFGNEGRKLFAKIRPLKDAEKLEALAIPTAESAAAVRKLLR
jgi:hypothetical protein